PLASWLRVAALRIAADVTRRDAGHAAPEAPLPAGAWADVPELRVLEARYRLAFRVAFRSAFGSLAAGERAVLKLHFVDGLTVRRLAPVLGVSPATAGRRLLAAQHRLAEAVVSQLARETDHPVEDLESVVRALVSRLEVSLSALIQ